MEYRAKALGGNFQAYLPFWHFSLRNFFDVIPSVAMGEGGVHEGCGNDDAVIAPEAPIAHVDQKEEAQIEQETLAAEEETVTKRQPLPNGVQKRKSSFYGKDDVYRKKDKVSWYEDTYQYHSGPFSA